MEPLCNPEKDRQVKRLKAPPHKPLSNELLFPKGVEGGRDLKVLKEHLYNEGRVDKEDVVRLVEECQYILS